MKQRMNHRYMTPISSILKSDVKNNTFRLMWGLEGNKPPTYDYNIDDYIYDCAIVFCNSDILTHIFEIVTITKNVQFKFESSFRLNFSNNSLNSDFLVSDTNRNVKFKEIHFHSPVGTVRNILRPE